jgi:hypothetical protein
VLADAAHPASAGSDAVLPFAITSATRCPAAAPVASKSAQKSKNVRTMTALNWFGPSWRKGKESKSFLVLFFKKEQKDFFLKIARDAFATYPCAKPNYGGGERKYYKP